MENAVQMAQRLREVILNGTWIANTNYKHQLTGLDWKIATKRYDSLNTIADLAQHIHYYLHGIKQVLEGEELQIKDVNSFNFPPIQSQEQWDRFLTRFWQDAEAFAVLVEQLPDERLQETFVDARYSTYLRNIEGMIEHSYYHLGQIVLLKKLLSGEIG